MLTNLLLNKLPSPVFMNIYPSLEPVGFYRGQTLVKAGSPVEYLYFLGEGIGSVITTASTGQVAEAGMFGREGFAPTSAGVGAKTSSHDIVMQIDGTGHRLPIEAAADFMDSHQIFANLLARYIQTFTTQISYTVWANVNLPIHGRLARWLLMAHDRIDGEEIVLTHDFIALMLGVRRPSITTGLHVLEGQKLIRSERGRITMRDRKGLEAVAGDAYGKPEQEYRSLIGPMV
jgi:CRP-like cAMP-binding protein